VVKDNVQIGYFNSDEYEMATTGLWYFSLSSSENIVCSNRLAAVLPELEVLFGIISLMVLGSVFLAIKTGKSNELFKKIDFNSLKGNAVSLIAVLALFIFIIIVIYKLASVC